VIDWYLITSREATSAFHLFSKVKERFGSASTIVSDRLPSYNQATKVVFEGSKHLKVQFWYDETTNNLIESFFKRLKHKYRTFHGLKVKESVEAILQEFFFFYNYILPHSSLNNETPARVAGVKYTKKDYCYTKKLNN
jgi:transposase-like protein